MSIEVKVPVLPESVSDATIATWHKKAGDSVRRDENLLDLETDKVVLEVPSPVDGKLKELKFKEGDTVNSQQVVAIIEEGAVEDAPKEEKKADAPKSDAKSDAKPAAKAESTKAPAKTGSAEVPPGARFAAETSGVDASQVEGTGRRGAVTKEDLVNYAAGRSSGVAGGNRPEERVPMTRIRKRIAERLMQSKDSIAMLTSFNEVNLGKVMAMRKELGEQF
ncbi:MAG TPA: biotin/lipoyl-containing protein, partial [Arenimonas sp.]|nr:biotin/lipoyl-containing protein [Arenimonas sp.]